MDNLIKVKFNRNGEPSGREYTYLSRDKVKVDDLVVIREADGEKEPQLGTVTATDIPEAEVESFKDKLKAIARVNVDKKVYSSYAFSEYEISKMRTNELIHKELMAKYRVSSGVTRYDSEQKKQVPINYDDFDLIYERKPGHNHAVYFINKNTTDLTDDELALIFDGGNLCFGYKKEATERFYVFED